MPGEATLFAEARTRGALHQRLCLMSAGEIPPSAQYEIGPIKVLLDEQDLPPLDDVVARLRFARSLRRCVAIHCVTEAELVLSLAAFVAAGAVCGDRLEHGGVIPDALIEPIRALGLCVVTQPNFIHDRGNRHAETIPSTEWPDL